MGRKKKLQLSCTGSASPNSCSHVFQEGVRCSLMHSLDAISHALIRVPGLHTCKQSYLCRWGFNLGRAALVAAVVGVKNRPELRPKQKAFDGLSGCAGKSHPQPTCCLRLQCTGLDLTRMRGGANKGEQSSPLSSQTHTHAHTQHTHA
eukprot:1159075-Pelagomonas_calceolata.AAC.3